MSITKLPTLAALCLAALASNLAAQETPPTGTEMPLTAEARSQALAQLDPEYLKWLQSVRGLMTQPELDYFLRLEEDFRRAAFLRAFWEPRDPDPRTRGNELEARWEQYKDAAGGVPYGDPRFLLLLFNGPPGGWSLPDGRPVSRCFSRSKELEIWFYGASERTERRFPVIVLRRGSEVPYEVHQPGTSLRAMQRSGGLPTTDLGLLCADDLLRYTLGEISRIPDYDQLLRGVLAPLLPSPEWLANLAASATDLPRGAETFEVDFELGFPVRKQSRTAVQVMLGVAREASPGRRFPEGLTEGEQAKHLPEGEQAEHHEGELFHNFQLVGEVIRDGKLFESFRYRFEGPTPEEATTTAIGFTRFLRPGAAQLRILLEDLYSGTFAQVVRQIDVPSPEGLPTLSAAAAPETAVGPALELYPPPGNVHVGRMRFRARATGDLEKVTFFLDDKPVLSKRRPPFSVELDLGETPGPRRVRVVGFAGGREVATDQVWLNQGVQRFRVHLIEPRPGGIYPGSLTARIQVDTPNGDPPERLELYLDGEPVTTLRQPPFEHRLRLPASEIAVIRAVAYLADGSASEDVVVVGGSFSETVEVRLVELDVQVTGADGLPIPDLSRERFHVFEDDAPQELRRFEAAKDAGTSTVLLVDRSISMEPHLGKVADAAGAFSTAALRSQEDRIAVLSFADDLTVDQGFTSSTASIERALAGMRALGGTALYDGVVQALNTFEGTLGSWVLILFTDGQDETSRSTFEQTLETARRSGAMLHVIGLAEAFPDKESRRLFAQLASETGGVAIFPEGLDELPGVYLSILEDLRARYRLTYQPSGSGPASGFRNLRVEVDVEGAQVKTRKGYYP